MDRSQFQLAAMTALYLSVKTHEPEVMSSELVSTLSRGAHTEEEVELMERRVLHALTWQVNPPTTLSFVREFLKLLPAELLDHEMHMTLMEICKFQSELAVADYNLVAMGASSIAYASLMNGLESLCMDRSILGYVSSIVSQAAGINLFSEHLVQIQIRLCQAVAQTQQPVAVALPQPVAVQQPVQQHQMLQQQQPQQLVQQQQQQHPRGQNFGGGACGRSLGPKRTSFKASPCTVTRMEV